MFWFHNPGVLGRLLHGRLVQNRLAIGLIVGLSLAATGSDVLAQKKSFGDRLMSPFRRVSVSTERDSLELKDTHGPWLIMCASFIVEGKPDAEKLCEELRQAGFEPYLYEKTFDYSDSIEGLGYQKPEGGYGLEPKRMRTARPDKIEDISVLVGNFPTAEDRNGLRSLEKIKRMKPKTLHVSENSRSLQRLGGFREMIRTFSDDASMKEMGPMRGAFMVPNPLLPDEFFDRQLVDPIVIKMNKGDKFSLLENPKAYTVKVASFRGDSTVNEKEIEAQTQELNFLQRTGRGLQESRLMEAEVNANFLTEKLRSEGVEAYSYHDRYSSIVCVGSFDWVVENPDSIDKRVNPEVQAVIDRFMAGVNNSVPGASFFAVKTVVSPTGKRISFDPIPVAVSVPKLQ